MSEASTGQADNTRTYSNVAGDRHNFAKRRTLSWIVLANRAARHGHNNGTSVWVGHLGKRTRDARFELIVSHDENRFTGVADCGRYVTWERCTVFAATCHSLHHPSPMSTAAQNIVITRTNTRTVRFFEPGMKPNKACSLRLGLACAQDVRISCT